MIAVARDSQTGQGHYVQLVRSLQGRDLQHSQLDAFAHIAIICEREVPPQVGREFQPDLEIQILVEQQEQNSGKQQMFSLITVMFITFAAQTGQVHCRYAG